MRRKLMYYRLKWKRPCYLRPENHELVLARFRGKDDGFTLLVYDSNKSLWVQPALGKVTQSCCYDDHEIFAWTRLPGDGLIMLESSYGIN